MTEKKTKKSLQKKLPKEERRLDYLVAKELGLKVKKGNPRSKNVFGRLDSIECNEESLFWSEDPVHKMIPRFSTDDEVAFKLLCHMRKSGNFCCINISSDYHYTWDISATLSQLDLLDTKEKEHKVCAQVSTESFAYGVCLLFLRGMEASRKQDALIRSLKRKK